MKSAESLVGIYHILRRLLFFTQVKNNYHTTLPYSVFYSSSSPAPYAATLTILTLVSKETYNSVKRDLH
jgi:hypothetical protein